ncbi:MAG: lipid A biosynthesis acyltransferase [Chitinophagaceae bacterium]|nr:MAG: lipid A biosynthesis acyltransferase [Chitinophagaceae bacterium]
MRWLAAGASFVFFLMYYVISYRKVVVIQNISRSFPDMRYSEVQEIVKKFYASFTAYFAEIIKSVSISPVNLDKTIAFENLELLDHHIDSGRNVIACLGHCGNWEMLNFLPHKTKNKVYAVYKPLSSSLANRIMIKIRSRFGMKLLTDKSVVRHLLSKKTSPAVYLFIADQRPPIQEENYRLTLLNQDTYIFSGVEKLARVTDSAVVYINIAQVSKGHYKFTFMPVTSDPKSMPDGEITRSFVDRLTENINEEPYGWLWTHKRWK